MSALTDTAPIYALEIARADARSPQRGRRWLARVLEAAHVPQATIDAAVLAASELVTNAAVHAGGRIIVSAQHSAAGVRLVVHDDGRAARPWQAPGGDADERGRGLVIVAALADELDITLDESGTTVTALIPEAAR